MAYLGEEEMEDFCGLGSGITSLTSSGFWTGRQVGIMADKPTNRLKGPKGNSTQKG